MKKIIIALIAWVTLLACNEGESKLGVDLFEQGIGQGGVQLVDVRTPLEFQKEHITKALNYDINGDSFTMQVNRLDKEKPVYVYCLSGGRSGAAVEYLKEEGFKNVLELEGGMLAWSKAGKPVESSKPVAAAENPVEKEVRETIAKDKLTMIDFFAYWCGPCMKMKPSIDKLEKELNSDVTILSVNVDEQVALSSKYGITAMPTLIFFKNDKEVKRVVGYQNERQLRKLIASYK